MVLLSYEEASEVLRCAPGTLRKRVMRGEVPHIKFGGRNGRVFFRRQDLERFVNDHQVDPVADGNR